MKLASEFPLAWIYRFGTRYSMKFAKEHSGSGMIGSSNIRTSNFARAVYLHSTATKRIMDGITKPNIS